MKINKGNPYLKPLNELNLKVNYNFIGNDFSLSLNPGYSIINNTISTKYKIVNNGVSQSETFNISKIHKLGCEFEMEFSFFDIFDPYIETEIFYFNFPEKKYNGIAHSTEIGMEISLPVDFYIDMNITLNSIEREYSSYTKESYIFDYFIVGKNFLNGSINTSVTFRSFLPKIEKSFQTTEQNSYKRDYSTEMDSKYIMFRFRYIFNKGKSLKNRNIRLEMENESSNVNRNKKLNK